MWKFLPVLLLLACPLMMVWCMRGMRGHGQAEDANATSGETARLKQEIAELREEIARQKAEQRLGG